MTVTEVRKMAHSFLKSMRVQKVDTNHDNEENGSSVVESFVARKDDPDFIFDSWVVGIHVPDGTIWQKIKSGELNGFSMEALVKSKPQFIEIEVPEDGLVGKTAMEEDHDHDFLVMIDDAGNFIGGKTNMVNGHFHTIKSATVTDQSMGHAHRYSFVEEMTRV